MFRKLLACCIELRLEVRFSFGLNHLTGDELAFDDFHAIRGELARICISKSDVDRFAVTRLRRAAMNVRFRQFRRSNRGFGFGNRDLGATHGIGGRITMFIFVCNQLV